jgi:S-adenosylmethionine:tRNA ribosyltransferase-isomerase
VLHSPGSREDDRVRNSTRIDLFDFELPAGSMLRPASPRDSARMLIVQPDGVVRERRCAFKKPTDAHFAES